MSAADWCADADGQRERHARNLQRGVHTLGVDVSFALRPLSDDGAFACAPSSTPMPRRSTSSKPIQPVTRAITMPRAETKIAVGDDTPIDQRSIQLSMNSTVTMTLPMPCCMPIAFARV